MRAGVTFALLILSGEVKYMTMSFSQRFPTRVGFFISGMRVTGFSAAILPYRYVT